jgi:hypothetical protein
LGDGEVLGVGAEVGVVVAEDPLADGETADVGAHRIYDPSELVAEDRAFRPVMPVKPRTNHG